MPTSQTVTVTVLCNRMAVRVYCQNGYGLAVVLRFEYQVVAI